MEDFVRGAIRDAGLITVDERGLMPLAEARAHLATTEEFGDWRGHRDREDKTWAALMSLGDADEFVREASKTRWIGSPRSMFNVAPHQRYGDAILPWLVRFVDPKKGALVDVPWCVAPCLARIPGEAPFLELLDLQTLETTSYVFGTYEKLFGAMLDRDPTSRWPLLAKRALDGDGRAKDLFKKFVKGRSRGALLAIEAGLGKEVRARVEKTFKVTAKLGALEVLAVLDAGHAAEEWPFWNHEFEPRLEYVALRLLAVRTEDERWGICLERLTGGDWDHLHFERFLFGSEVSPGRSKELASPDIRIEGPAEFDGAAVGSTIRGPAGAITLEKSQLKSLDLKAGKGCEPDSGGEQLVLLRAYLATFPNAIWEPPEVLARELGFDEMPQDHVLTTEFQHGGDRTTPPSKTKTYKSLAEALACGDMTRFVPGKDNTDWRKHVLK